MLTILYCCGFCTFSSNLAMCINCNQQVLNATAMSTLHALFQSSVPEKSLPAKMNAKIITVSDHLLEEYLSSFIVLYYEAD